MAAIIQNIFGFKSQIFSYIFLSILNIGILERETLCRPLRQYDMANMLIAEVLATKAHEDPDEQSVLQESCEKENEGGK